MSDLIIRRNTSNNFIVLNSHGDHRIGMTCIICALSPLRWLKDSNFIIKDIDCIQTSFPVFLEICSNLHKVEVNYI